MKDGLWINYRTGKDFVIDEHEQWIRRKGNAKKLGLPKKVIDGFSKFKPVKDRDKFLLFIMKNAPVMRVRGHGNYATFEFASRNRRQTMDSVWMWGEENAGPYTGLRIVNFATGEEVSMMYEQFEKLMDIGPDEIMRHASIEKIEVKKHIAREILAISKELLLA